MHLRRIWLDELRDGRPLDMEMATDHTVGPILRYVVGPNGSGKSRLLASLGRIVSSLSAGVPPEIGFELRYRLGELEVVLTTRRETVAELLESEKVPPALERVGIWLLTQRAGEAWQLEARWPTPPTGILPARVVTSSSGPVSRLAWAVTEARQERIRREMARRRAEAENSAPEAGSTLTAEQIRELSGQVLGDLREQLRDAVESSTAIEVAPADALLAAIALHLHPYSEDSDGTEMIMDRLGAEPSGVPVAVMLSLAPEWRTLVSRPQRRTLGRLEEVALRSSSRAVAPAADGQREPGQERTLVIGRSAGTEKALREVAETPRVLFETLLMYKRCGALVESHMALSTAHAEDLILDEDLSDGEFLLLGRYSLLTLYKGMDDCLFLLDEPETHFNDEWRVSLVADIERLLRSDVERAAEVLITTHSELTLTDAERKDVYLLDRVPAPREDDAPIVPGLPSISTLAADRGAVAESVFGRDSALGRRAQELIDSALEMTDPEAVAAAIERMGPGLGRFRVMHHLNELRGDGRDAP